MLLGIIIAAMSGLPGLLWGRTAMAGQWVATLAGGAGRRAWPGGHRLILVNGDSQPIEWPWSIPGAEFNVAIDGLSAIFLAPMFLISLLGNVFGLGYWKQTEHPENGRKLRFFYGTMTAGHGPARHRQERHAVSLRLGDDGDLGLLSGRDRG